MESFRQNIHKRIIIVGIYCFIILLLIAASLIINLHNSSVMYTLGCCVGTEVFEIFHTKKYLDALSDE